MADAYNAYRSMMANSRQSVEHTANEIMQAWKEKGLLDESVYRTMRMRLLGGNYRTEREKAVLIKLVDELRKMLVA